MKTRSNKQSELSESELLNQIEQSSNRTFHQVVIFNIKIFLLKSIQARALNDEAQEHVRLLDAIDNDMEAASSGLHGNTENAFKVNQSRDNNCWLYIVILIELGLLGFLLYWGLS